MKIKKKATFRESKNSKPFRKAYKDQLRNCVRKVPVHFASIIRICATGYEVFDMSELSEVCAECFLFYLTCLSGVTQGLPLSPGLVTFVCCMIEWQNLKLARVETRYAKLYIRRWVDDIFGLVYISTGSSIGRRFLKKTWLW